MSSGGHWPPDALHLERFPAAARQARQTAHRLLTRGLDRLFSDEHQTLVPHAIRFLEHRIGVEQSTSGTTS